MKKYKELLAVIVLVLFLAAVGSMAVMSFPTSVSAGFIPIITLPTVSIPTITIPPDILLLSNKFREISTDSGIGNFTDTYTGGLDYGMNDVLAVGSLDESDTEIRFYDGTSWFSRDVDFKPSGLEWQLDYRPLLYASDSSNDNIYVSSNPTSKFPQWTKIAGPGSGIGEFDSPLGMTTNQNDTLYVVDAGNDRVQYYSDGEWYVLPDIPGAGTLIDITVVGFSFYVTDYAENCIWHKLGFAPWVKIENPSYLNYPTYMDADSDGNIYIVSWLPTGDEYERAIVKYDGSNFGIYVSPGENVGNIGTTISLFEEICINHHDKLFFSDNTYSRVQKEKDSINELTGLTINDFQFQLMEGWTEASMTVGHGEAEVEIITYKMCPYSIVEGAGTHPLEFGENVFPITCIPETGASKEYTITITRELSDNALLSNIAIDSLSISGFNPAIYAYTGINLSNETESVELEAIPQDPNATVSGAGTVNLDVGDNLFVINVLAQDGVTDQQYVVNLTRAEAPVSPSPSPSPSASPTPTPSPSSSTSPTPSPSPSPSTSPSASPTTSPSSSPSTEPSATPTPTPTPSATPTPSSDGSTSPSPTPGSSEETTPSPLPSEPATPEEESTGFGNYIKNHPGIAAAAGVVIGGTFILVTQQIIKKRKKKKADKPAE